MELHSHDIDLDKIDIPILDYYTTNDTYFTSEDYFTLEKLKDLKKDEKEKQKEEKDKKKKEKKTVSFEDITSHLPQRPSLKAVVRHFAPVMYAVMGVITFGFGLFLNSYYLVLGKRRRRRRKRNANGFFTEVNY